MKKQSDPSIKRAAAAFAILASSVSLPTLYAPLALADNVNVAPATCVAPYLDQAFPMRWHENYLMNPTSNGATWVICPVNFDGDYLPTEFGAVVFGARMSGSSAELPYCVLTIHNAVNMAQPPYLNGQAFRYYQGMSSETVVAGQPVWAAGTHLSADDAIPSVGNSRNLLAMAVVCRLPPGYSISQVSISN